MSDREAFRPRDHRPPGTLVDTIRFRLRALVDFQVATVLKDVERYLSGRTGTIADIGAGAGPYRHLFKSAGVEYLGLDTNAADVFGYQTSDVLHFDGTRLPLADSSVDGLICTEVLEHVADPDVLVQEMHRVLRRGGTGLVTIPWSARNHYIPWDYRRLTPTSLELLFGAFASVDVQPRGTDVTVIASKVIVVCSRAILRQRHMLSRIAWSMGCSPILGVAVIIGQASLRADLGSRDDPLGYSVFLAK